MKTLIKSKLNLLLIFAIFILLIGFFALKISPKDKIKSISISYLQNYAKGDFKRNQKYTDYELDEYTLTMLMSARDKRLSKANLLITNPLLYEEDGMERAVVYYNFVIQGNKTLENGSLNLYKDNGKWLISSN